MARVLNQSYFIQKGGYLNLGIKAARKDIINVNIEDIDVPKEVIKLANICVILG